MPDQTIDSLTVHGVTIANGQVRAADDTFLLSDIRAVHVRMNHNAWQRWLWWVVSFVAVLFLQWLALPLFFWSAWVVYFSESQTVQVTTSSGTHHLITFSTYNTMSEGATARLRQQATEVSDAISQRLG